MRNSVLAGGSFLLVSNLLAHAATVTVCDEANLRNAVAAGGTISFACDGTIALSSTVTITADTILDGSGRTVIVSGNGAVRVFCVNPGVQFTLRNLTIANGSVVGTNSLVPSGPGEEAFGAGIYNRGTLTLIDCSLTQHLTRGGTGGPRAAMPGGPGGNAGGAAVYNDNGSLWCTGSVFSANTAIGGMGGDDQFVTGNLEGPGGHAFGGALFCRQGDYALSRTTFHQNISRGGPAAGGPGSTTHGQAGSGLGGAIYSLTATGTVFSCELHSNYAVGASVPWTGGSGEATGGAICISNSFLEIFSGVFAFNVAQAGFNARHGFKGAARGGAIANFGTTVLNDTIFQGNSVVGGDNGTDGSHAYGGALDNSGVLFVRGCAFFRNEAHGGHGGGVSLGSWPGGNAYGGALHNPGVVSLTNSTFVANLARGGDRRVTPSSLDGGDGNGGAIANLGTLTATHITVASNAAFRGRRFAQSQNPPGSGGGVYTTNTTSIVRNTIIAHNIVGSNGFGTLVDEANNLSSDASCQFTAPGSLNNTDPVLSPLDDFGGATPTMALLDGSPAINAGLPLHCAATDQRGVTRPFGGGCDIGAFESAPPYTVRGTIHGYKPPQGISVGAGFSSGTSDSTGKYILFGLATGTHNIVPSSSEAVCIPNSRTIDVTSDTLGIDFKGYRFNGLTIDGFSDQRLAVVYAGAPGQVRAIQKSPLLEGPWVSFSTNTVGPEGIFTFDLPVMPAATHEYFRARHLEP